MRLKNTYFKRTAKTFAGLFTIMLLCFTLGSATTTQTAHALADDISFIIAKTSVRQSTASFTEDGEYLYAYRSDHEEGFEKSTTGDYVFNNQNEQYYLINSYPKCNESGGIGNTHIKVIESANTYILPILNNRYNKVYNYGYNYTLFPDFIKDNSNGRYIYYENRFRELVFYSDINTFDKDGNPATSWDNASYVEILTDERIDVAINTQRYVFQNGMFSANNQIGNYIRHDLYDDEVGGYTKIVLASNVNVLDENKQPTQGNSILNHWNMASFVEVNSGNFLPIEHNQAHDNYTMRYANKQTEKFTAHPNGNYLYSNGNYYEIIEGENGNCYKDLGGTYVQTNTLSSATHLRVRVNNNYQYLKIYSTSARFIKNPNTYYYDIFKVQTSSDGIPTSMEAFRFNETTYKVKDKETTGAYLPTYFTAGELAGLYYKTDVQSSTSIIVNEEIYQPLFSDIIHNTTKPAGANQSEPFITLDNYKAKTNLENNLSTTENIENLYLSFGDIYLPQQNEFSRRLTNLQVTATLQNKYTNNSNGLQLALNDVVRQDTVVRNEFWYQYLDATNLEYYVTGDISGATAPVLHADGLYTFYFSGQYALNESRYENFSHTYSFYLSTTESAALYPVLNEEIHTSVDGENLSGSSFATYYYNFQTTTPPIYTFDASKYNTTITKSLYQTVNTVTTDFKTLQINQGDIQLPVPYLTSNELGLVTYLQDNVPFEQLRIQAELRTFVSSDTHPNGNRYIAELGGESDDTKAYVYTYIYRKADMTSTNYLANNFGQFDKKLTTIIFVKEHASTTVTTTKHYQSFDANTANDYMAFGSKDMLKMERVVIEKNIQNYTIENYPNEKKLTHVVTTANYSYYESSDNIDFNSLASLSYKTVTTQSFECGTFTLNGHGFVSDSKLVGTYTEITTATSGFDYRHIKDTYQETLQGKHQFRFDVSIILDELGVYNIANKYLVSAQFKNATTNNISDIASNVINPANNTYNVKKKYHTLNEDGTTTHHNYLKHGYTLHVFGLKSYFNKNGKTEFKNDSLNIYSNITEQAYKQNAALNENSAGVTLQVINGRRYPIANLPITNMVPISFDYSAIFAYQPGAPAPISKFHKYNFAYDSGGQPYIVGTHTSHYFTKDTLPSSDGYYEIIVKYSYTSYNTLVQDDSYFYQVFAFIIDNSSPDVNFEKLVTHTDFDGSTYQEWTLLNKEGYSNDDVRITWNKTSYFQYDVVPSILKTNFAGISNEHGSAQYDGLAAPASAYTTFDISYNYNGETKYIETSSRARISYKRYNNSNLYEVPELKLSVYTTTSHTTLVDTINNIYPSNFKSSSFIEQIEDYKQKGYSLDFSIQRELVQIVIPKTNENNAAYWGSGNYSIRLNYGSDTSSYLTQRLTIDTLGISGMKIAPVDMDAINKSISSKSFEADRLIAEPFTFMYARKNSGATITTTYTAIPFASANNIDLLNLQDSLSAITANEFIFANSSTVNLTNSYSYNYSFYNTGDAVYLNNIFSPSTSMLYIFNLKDSAGNTAQFFVVYDTSNPNFFVDTNFSDSYLKQFNIINDITDVVWGNYKAIEIDGEVDNQYVFGNKSHTTTKLNTLLKDIVTHPTNYMGIKVKPMWQLNNGDWQEAILKADGTFDYIVENHVYKTPDGLTLNQNYDGILVRYFILMPLASASFEYFNTDTEDNNMQSFAYETSSAQPLLSKSSTILAPSKKSLAIKIFGENYTPQQLLQIENDTQHIYGFYGEKKYAYTITDIMGNEQGNTLWMNLDMSVGFAYGNFTNTLNTLSQNTHIPNLEQLTPHNTYSASQLYFSYVEGGSAPKTRVDYKYYDFDFDFYASATLTGIVYDSGVYTFTYTHNGITKEMAINTNNQNNTNADDEQVNEPVAMFPFSLAASTDTSNWKILEKSTYRNTSDTRRSYSNLINPTFEQNETGSQTYAKTKPGMYVIRRTYTDYIDEQGNVTNAIENLENQTAYKYYVYIVDRNGIINLTDLYGQALDLNNLNMLLGAGIGDASYSTHITEQDILNKAISNNTSNNASYSSMTVNNLLLTNKVIAQLNISMDKYNQPLFYNNFISNNNFNPDTIKNFIKDSNIPSDYYTTPGTNDPSVIDAQSIEYFYKLLNTYMFGVPQNKASETGFDAKNYYNEKFLIRVDLTFGNNYSIIGAKNSTYNTINPQNDGSNRFLLSSLQNRTTTTTSTHRSQLQDGILLNINNQNFDTYNYNIKITDSAGITESSNKEQWNKYANSISFNFGINASYPVGSFFGKYTTGIYQSSDAINIDDYRTKLFKDDIIPQRLENKLEDLNSIISLNGQFTTLKDTNNKSLIFVFDKTSNIYSADINPYNISITRTLPNGTVSNIFTVTEQAGNLVYNASGSTNTAAKMANAFINNASSNAHSPLATSWAVVLFDGDSNLYPQMKLSDYDINATYEVTINFKGLPSDYSDLYNTTYYTAKYSITIDNTKPLYNIIQLMEQDKYTAKAKYNYPQNATSIREYYENNLIHLADLRIQQELETIYNYYAEFYALKDSLGNNIPFDEKTNASIIQNHFFAIDANFVFSKAAKDTLTSSSFDTYDRIYYRKIDENNLSNYRFSLTKDDYIYSSNNHPLFNAESAQQGISTEIGSDQYYYQDFKGSTNHFTADDLKFVQGCYYEIIERDEAGNYRVYAIYYASETPYSYNYTKATGSSSTSDTNGQLSSAQPVHHIYGKDLIITCNTPETNDLFLSANIDYYYTLENNSVASNRPIVIKLDPIKKRIVVNLNNNPLELASLEIDLSSQSTNQYTQSFLDVVTNVYTAIIQNNNQVIDFVLTITFNNRASTNYVINYYVPGQELKYIRNGNQITIPADSDYVATKIMQLDVQQYISGSWQTISIDSNRKNITKGNGTYSLGGKLGAAYVFRNGTYRFTLSDNFGRTSVYYESFDTTGLVTQKLEYSGATSTLNNLTYTAKQVLATYNPARYMAVVYAKIENGENILIKEITNNEYVGMLNGKIVFTINKRVITENNMSVATMVMNVNHGYHVQFKTIIINIADMTKDYSEEYFNENKQRIEHYEYDFVIYTKLPSVQIKNLNGVVIPHQNGQSYLEDLAISWSERYTDGKTFDFNAKMNLRRIDENGVTHNQTITSNYTISLSGSYTLTITNELGYTYDSITFTKVSANSALMYKVFSKNVTTGEQVELGISTHTYMSSESEGLQQGIIVYNYYALDTFNNYINTTQQPNTARNHIFLISNTDNSVMAQLVVLPISILDTQFAIYKIYDSKSGFIYRYVKVNFIPKSNEDFAGTKVISNKKSGSDNYYSDIDLISHIIKTSQDEIILNFNSKDSGNNLISYNKVVGNNIIITRYYNGLEVEKINLANLPRNLNGIDGYSLVLKESGHHKIVITDLAGNVSLFMSVPYLSIYIINSVIYQVNNDAPVQNQIFNLPVELEVITRLESTILYDNNNYSIQVTRNGSEYSAENYKPVNNRYTFHESGYYEVTLKAYGAGLQEEISSTYTFRIINPNTTSSSFSVSSANNFRVLSIKKKVDNNQDSSYIDLAIPEYNQIQISATDARTGEGYYQITLEAYIESIKQTRQFTFELWISDGSPSISASIPFGTSTTDAIVLSYNPLTIYQMIGESRIVINGQTIESINANSTNETKTYTITLKNEYWVQIVTSDGTILKSYKLIKKDPLNANAKVAIYLSAIAFVALTVIFIVIRRKRKFK